MMFQENPEKTHQALHYLLKHRCLRDIATFDDYQCSFTPTLQGLSVLAYAHYWKDRIQFNQPHYSYNYFFCHEYDTFIKIIQHLIKTAPNQTKIIFCNLFIVHYSCYVFEKWNDKSYLFSFDSTQHLSEDILQSLTPEEQINFLYAVPTIRRQKAPDCKFFTIRNCHHVNSLPPLCHISRKIKPGRFRQYTFDLPHRLLEDAQDKSQLSEQAIVVKRGGGESYLLAEKINTGIRYDESIKDSAGVPHNLAISHFEKKYTDALIGKFTSGQTLTMDQITVAHRQGVLLNEKKALHLSNILKAISDDQIRDFLRLRDANRLLSLSSGQLKLFLYNPNLHTLKPEQLYFFAAASSLPPEMPSAIAPKPAPDDLFDF